MSQTIIFDEHTGQQIIYDPDDIRYGYESCRKKLDLRRNDGIISQEAHDTLISKLNIERIKALRPWEKLDNSDIELLLSE